MRKHVHKQSHSALIVMIALLVIVVFLALVRIPTGLISSGSVSSPNTSTDSSSKLDYLASLDGTIIQPRNNAVTDLVSAPAEVVSVSSAGTLINWNNDLLPTHIGLNGKPAADAKQSILVVGKACSDLEQTDPYTGVVSTYVVAGNGVVPFCQTSTECQRYGRAFPSVFEKGKITYYDAAFWQHDSGQLTSFISQQLLASNPDMGFSEGYSKVIEAIPSSGNSCLIQTALEIGCECMRADPKLMDKAIVTPFYDQ